MSISAELGGMIETFGMSGSPEDAKVGAYIGAITVVLKTAFLQTIEKIW
jgi:hypothetical protein